MGAPPLLHTLSSGRDRLLKKHTAPCPESSFKWEGYCNYETVISRNKEDKEEEWEVIIHLLNNDFAQDIALKAPQTKMCIWFCQRFFKFQKNR